MESEIVSNLWRRFLILLVKNEYYTFVTLPSESIRFFLSSDPHYSNQNHWISITQHQPLILDW